MKEVKYFSNKNWKYWVVCNTIQIFHATFTRAKYGNMKWPKKNYKNQNYRNSNKVGTKTSGLFIFNCCVVLASHDIAIDTGRAALFSRKFKCPSTQKYKKWSVPKARSYLKTIWRFQKKVKNCTLGSWNLTRNRMVKNVPIKHRTCTRDKKKNKKRHSG